MFLQVLLRVETSAAKPKVQTLHWLATPKCTIRFTTRYLKVLAPRLELGDLPRSEGCRLQIANTAVYSSYKSALRLGLFRV